MTEQVHLSQSKTNGVKKKSENSYGTQSHHYEMISEFPSPVNKHATFGLHKRDVFIY